jgi:predicted nucleic acid-binding protein
MTIVVHDASVLIDLLECELEENWCSLNLRLITTSFVWREINRRHQKTRLKTFVDRGALIIEPVGAETITEIFQLKTEMSPGVTVEDISVLLLSIRLRAVLLSSDGLLRRQAESRGIEVHGILWMLETLIDHGSISPLTAADRLERLLERNVSWLPREECKRRLAQWRKA